MSVTVEIDGKTYPGVERVDVGGKSMILTSDVTEPSGTKSITANGSYDVSEFVTAEVNVPTEGGSATLQELTITENGDYTPADGYDGFSKVIAAFAASGLPVHTGTHTVASANTQKKVTHNLNLESYAYIFWDVNMAEYIAGSDSTLNIVLSGCGMFNYDKNVSPSTVGSVAQGFRFAKTYKQSTKAWNGTNMTEADSVSEKADANSFYMHTTANIRATTYNWIVIDLTGLTAGGA